MGLNHFVVKPPADGERVGLETVKRQSILESIWGGNSEVKPLYLFLSQGNVDSLVKFL